MRSLSLIVAALGLLTTSFALSMPGQQPLDGQSGPIRATAGWDWQDCGLDTDAVKIESIEVFPDPPEPGKDMTVKVKGIAREVIEDGASADVTVKLGLIKILQKTFDICEEARTNNASIQCPVSEGTHIVEQTVALPKEIPKAKFVVDVNGYTASDDDMFCLKLTVDFMKKPFPPFW